MQWDWAGLLWCSPFISPRLMSVLRLCGEPLMIRRKLDFRFAMSVWAPYDSKSHNCHAQPYCLCTTFEGCRSMYAHMKYERSHDGGMFEIQISSSLWLVKPRNGCYPTSRQPNHDWVLDHTLWCYLNWFAGNRGSVELWFVVVAPARFWRTAIATVARI